MPESPPKSAPKSPPESPPNPPTDTSTGGPAYSTPRSLLLPTVDVQAGIDPVTVRDGVLAVPEDPSRVGWWVGGALPGASTGPTVIDGHIDSAERGLGVLRQLGRLAAGDLVQVVDGAGRTIDYRVVGRRSYDKSAGLPPELFTQDGNPRLVLISCGGPFDAELKSYRDNIVVFAVPA